MAKAKRTVPAGRAGKRKATRSSVGVKRTAGTPSAAKRKSAMGSSAGKKPGSERRVPVGAAAATGTPPVAAAPTTKRRKKPEPLPSVTEVLGGLVNRPVIEGEQQSRWPAQITIGDRYRLDKGDIAGLAASISARGGLIQPIAVDRDDKLIDGERRLLAWQHQACRFRDRPIPVTVIDIDSIVAGEYDANAYRKAFTPSEMVAIKRALEPRLKEEAKARQAAQGGTVPKQRKAGKPPQADMFDGEIPRSEGESGRAASKVAVAVGKDRRTIEKAEKVVQAAERDPERFGRLKEDMDRTGKVDGPYKRLQVMEQTDAIRAAPPPLPMNGPYGTVVIDFPWSAEERDQDKIDAAGRSFRGYPEMSVRSCCEFAREKIIPILSPDAAVWLWVPNFHLVKGYAHHVIAALGFEGRGKTMLTWDKVELGRGQVLRDQTEHCILLTRGSPVINVFGEDPPTTLLRAARREGSRKPDEFYRLVERLTPAPRYASLFSRGGEGDAWDCHGDEVGKFAAATGASEAQAHVDKIEDRIGAALEAVLGGGVVGDEEIRGLLQKQKLISGKSRLKLTPAGTDRLKQWRTAAEARALAALPDDLSDLIDDYKATLARRHTVIVGPEWQHLAGDPPLGRAELIERETARLERLLVKANGGDAFGMACDDSPAELLRVAARAPIGEVPMWGQRGMFRVEVDGLACLVSVSDGSAAVRACSDAPFISPSGYRSLAGAVDDGEWLFGLTVDQHLKGLISEAIVSDDSSGKRKPRKKAMPVPSNWYHLPASWDEADEPILVDPSQPDTLHSPGEPGVQSDGKPLAASADSDDDPELDEAIAWHEAQAAAADDGDDEAPEPLPDSLPPDDPGPIPEFLRRDRDGAEAAE